MTESSIYLDQQGNYRDRTPENLEAYPPAEDAVPAEDGGTELVTETGEDTPPVAKTRKSS